MNQITFQSVYDTPASPQAKLNSIGQTPDGRVWEYLYASEAISRAMVVSRPANTDVDTVSSSTDDAGNIIFITEASAGWTAGAFQDCWGLVDDGTGEGEGFKIKDNTADTLQLYLETKLSVALSVTDSDIVIVKEPQAEKVAVTTLLTPLKGVAQTGFASADYGYFLKRGIGYVLVGAAVTINELLTPGDDTEGTAINVGSGETLDDASSVGRVLVANTTADEEALVDVNIW